MNTKERHILLVEDNPDDAFFAEECFSSVAPEIVLQVASDGKSARAKLDGYLQEDKLPDLILLDLNFPQEGGFDFLERVKHDKKTNCIPVIILTTSNSSRDIMHAYSLGANGYIIKPLSFDEFLKMAEEIKTFWFQTCRIPTDIPFRGIGGS